MTGVKGMVAGSKIVREGVNMIRDHKELDVWRVSVDLVTKVYQMTQDFPSNELSGLTSQIRRAAVSIPATIAEGAAQRTNREFVEFLTKARGAAAEVESYITTARRLKYVVHADELLITLSSVTKMLDEIIRHYQSSAELHD
jgi:four helix bundle protein